MNKFRLPRGDRFTLWLLAIPMTLIAFSTIYPIFFTLNIALKTRKEFILNRFNLAEAFNLENFLTIWSLSNLKLYFFNSVLTTGGTVLLLLLLSSMAGYAFSHLKFGGRKSLYLLSLAAMMIPIQVILVPYFQLILGLNLLNQHLGLILSYTSMFLPFSIYLMTKFYSGIPKELVEAARLDGASTWQTYRYIMLPLGKPALLSLGILNTLFCWNDILVALLVMQDKNSRTLMIGVSALRGEYSANIPLFAAGVIVAALPVIIVFLIFQRQIAAGITMGATKG